jgi:CheY-like chemotaxis protein
VTAPKRIVVVDDEPHIRLLLGQMLPAPDFEVHPFADPRDALMKLHDIAPDLIICDVMMPDMDGRTFLQVVKRSQDLRDVPFIFLSAVKEVNEVVQAYEVGADDFVEKPFHLARLMAKVRAMLRLAERRRTDALTGPVRGEGTLALLKFCEDNHLTGRLTVFATGQERWAEFLGGEVMRAGGTPEEEGLDPLDALLALRTGTYRIEQRRLDRRAVDEALARQRDETAAAAPAAAPAGERDEQDADEGLPPPSLPEGRLSRVRVRGSEVQVQTEAANRPLFTVTTILARDGQVLRKIESAWPHALKRREDVELARAQIERQHERVVSTLRELGGEAPPPAGAETVDPSLLAWALSFVCEQVRHHLGAVMAVALLRRTHKALLKEQPLLRAFRVAEDGRVQVEGAAAPLPAGAVLAAAAWTAAFIEAAAELVERVRSLRLRTVTRMMEAELERIGFYSACDEALQRKT